MSIVSLDEIKVNLVGVSGDTKDALLTDIRDGVEKMVKNYIGHEIESSSYVELYDGSGNKNLVLNNYPVSSVALISGDLDFDTKLYGSVVDDTDYIVDADSGMIEFLWSTWTRGQRNWLVSYTAGYSSANMPADIKLVVLEIVQAKYYKTNEKRTGITNKTVMSETVSFETIRDISSDHRKILDQYKNHSSRRGIPVTGWGGDS